MLRKTYKFHEGQTVKQKITGWRVVLLCKNWRIDQSRVGEWQGKMWIKTDNGSFWEQGNFFESELE